MNYQGFNQQIDPAELEKLREMRKAMRTSSGIRWLIYFVFGIIPIIIMMTLVSNYIQGPGLETWYPVTKIIESLNWISYGDMWLYTFLYWVALILFLTLTLRYFKSIKIDVVPNTIALAAFTTTFYIIPLDWGWCLLIGAFIWIIFYLLTAIVVAIVGATKFMKKAMNGETNMGSVENPFEIFMQSMRNAQHRPHNKKDDHEKKKKQEEDDVINLEPNKPKSNVEKENSLSDKNIESKIENLQKEIDTLKKQTKNRDSNNNIDNNQNHKNSFNDDDFKN